MPSPHELDLKVIQEQQVAIERREALQPSREFAWMLGVLSTGGHVEVDRGKMAVDSVDHDFLEKFRNVGEGLFQVNAGERKRTNENGEEELKGITFYSRDFSRQIGDLKRPDWPNTIIEKHPWVINDKRYAWGFLEGVFERIGYVVKPNPRKQRMYFYTNYIGAANFIADLLSRVDVQEPGLIADQQKKEGTQGVYIGRRMDLITLAQNIHPANKVKEERLKQYRELSPPYSKVKLKKEAKASKLKLTRELDISDTTLGGKLRAARRQSGKTITQFAGEIGFSSGHLSMTERNIGVPSARLVRLYQSRFGIPDDALDEIAPGAEGRSLARRLDLAITVFDLSTEQRRIVEEMLIESASVFANAIKKASEEKGE